MRMIKNDNYIRALLSFNDDKDDCYLRETAPLPVVEMRAQRQAKDR